MDIRKLVEKGVTTDFAYRKSRLQNYMNKFTICIDIKSYLFLNGMEIDYEEDLLKSGLVFNTPTAKRTCGCGESVAF